MKITYPLLTDGGLSNVLEDQGCNLNDKLWSARMLETNKEAIIQAHLSYLEAGAKCITTASYQASIAGFMSLGYDKSTSEGYILESVHLATRAVERFMSERPKASHPFIAASIGPYGAFLADGSEYHGNYGVSDQALKDFHISRLQLLDRSNADFFACETIPSFQETKVLAELLNETKKPAWVSFSCKDANHINDGTPIKECAQYLANHPNVFAIGANCTAPKYISGLIKSLKSVSTNMRIVVYPNSGEAYNAQSKSWIGISDPQLFFEMTKEWITLGADIIGGCCRIGPDHIYLLNKILHT